MGLPACQNRRSRYMLAKTRFQRQPKMRRKGIVCYQLWISIARSASIDGDTGNAKSSKIVHQGRPFFQSSPFDDHVEGFQYVGVRLAASTEKFGHSILSRLAPSTGFCEAYGKWPFSRVRTLFSTSMALLLTSALARPKTDYSIGNARSARHRCYLTQSVASSVESEQTLKSEQVTC